MKKTIILLSVLVCILLASCTTHGSASVYDPDDYDVVAVMSTYEDDSVSVKAVYDNISMQIHVTITNKTDNFLKLDYNESVFVANSLSSKVCDGETKKIDIAKTQPLISIAPNSSIKRTVCNADDSSNGMFVPLKDTFTLYLTVKDGDSSIYCKLDFVTTEKTENKDVLGTVSDSYTQWHFFFTGDTMQTVQERLLEKAKILYNTEQVHLENISYSAKWSGASLLLYFNLFGYAEKVTASADVVITRK